MEKLKYKMSWGRKVIASVLTAVLVISLLPVCAGAHGTSSQVAVYDPEKNTPPEDYVINQDTQGSAKNGEYDRYFLKEDLQTVKIDIDEDNLNYLLQNAEEKPSVMTKSVTIGNQSVGYVGLKTKGNYTLSATNEDNSDRFSFSVNFGKYIKKAQYGEKQNFFGCNKISFNNFYFDKTMMKEYCALKLMTEMGLPTPQYGLAKLYINNNYYGVYFMVENMDRSILQQYMHVSSKGVSDYLVKPEGTKLQYDTALDNYLDSQSGSFTMESLSPLLDIQSGNYVASGVLEDSSALWEQDADTLQDVAPMLPTVLNWEKKLGQLGSGKNFNGEKLDVNSAAYLECLSQIMDVDEVVRYFAVHSFIVQLDNMFDDPYQNYGLYVDTNGKAMILPWDYDLSWGCFFPPNDAESVANLDWDVMYSTQFYNTTKPETVYKNFPLFYVIYQNKELMERYHKYMEDCAKLVSLGGTTSDNDTYEAGRFNAAIRTLETKLKAAASEKLASNVTYLNGIAQPSGVINGLPNLSKILAMRATGVWVQKNGIRTTVGGQGCSLFALGNGADGRVMSSGSITTVDSTTGIFATATYGAAGMQRPGNWNQPGPVMSVFTLKTTDDVFVKLKEKLNCSSDSDLTVYQLSCTKIPTSSYQLYVPVSKAYGNASLYRYDAFTGVADKLETSCIDSVYCATVSGLGYMAVVKERAQQDKIDDAAGRDKKGDGEKVAATTGNSVKNPAKVSSFKVKSKKNKKVQLSWKKVSGAKGYQIQYSQTKKFKASKTKKKTTKKKKITVSGLKRGKTYFFRVRAYKMVKGKKVYGKWSAVKKAKVKK